MKRKGLPLGYTEAFAKANYRIGCHEFGRLDSAYWTEMERHEKAIADITRRVNDEFREFRDCMSKTEFARTMAAARKAVKARMRFNASLSFDPIDPDVSPNTKTDGGD